MSFVNLYKFMLAIFACSFVVIHGANARRFDKRWIQSTGFGAAEPQYKRAIGDNGAGKTVGFQGDNGLFPKFPADDTDEFEKEVQEQETDKAGQPGAEAGTSDAVTEREESVPSGGQEGREQSPDGGQESEQSPDGGQESTDSEIVGQEPVEEDRGRTGYEKSGEVISGTDGVIDVTTRKPWYKKVHGFFKNHYDYLKERIGRGDDYYVNP